ncbi:SDR family NAD(P)-dependent oxidoreductase [Devosia riboflavina]|uniref:SDR family NAD(P)-dependent oxidoreductase n=1 Tax=Devosia riboflavina TaxID=46914 RepID=UPI00068A5B25|nr:SDR family oxidoreductase [Devosia riboflavina]
MTKFETVQRRGPLRIREPAIFPIHAGKRVIVTGAAGGLGKAIAGLLVAQGAKVVVVDLRQEAVNTAANELGGSTKGVFGYALDVADEAAAALCVTQSITWLGGIDGLVNCAGIVLHADPLAISRADWTRQFEVNLFGAYELARLVAKQMIVDGIHGAIVNIASEAGKKGHVDSMAYSASKAALINLTRTLAEALAPYDINVNCVCPGGMSTPMLREVAAVYSGITQTPADDVFAQMQSATLGRHTEPREVARVASFLLSDEAMMIRGQAVNADAGDTPY